jgi:hypothetical protein
LGRTVFATHLGAQPREFSYGSLGLTGRVGGAASYAKVNFVVTMGRYLSFAAEFTDHRATSEVFRAALEGDVFRPRGLGAIDIQESGTRWFLSGFGLESFIAHFIWRKTVKNPSITRDHSISDSQYSAYLDRLSEWIQRKAQPQVRDLSPHERLDEGYRATFLSSPVLQSQSIDAYEKWAEQSQTSAATLYGTFALCATGSASSPQCAMAYRFFPEKLDSGPGIPFLVIAGSRRIPESLAGPCTVKVFSESTAWLHDSRALMGHISNDCADVNLRNLAGVAQLMINHELKPRETILSLESQTFRRDRERIQRAFGHLKVGSMEW